jgi:L-lactate dehydrogenase complex protein LldF
VSGRPEYVAFGGYSRRVPPSIPAAVQQATGRFLGLREARVAEMPQWEDLRQAASELRRHTLAHLDVYLERLGRQVEAAGGHVHWAEDAERARAIVLEIAARHGVRRAVKSKSMATEEIALNEALERSGIEALETDLGEYIIQLAGMGPSHIIVPAVHMKKEEVAELFRLKLGVEAPPDPAALTAIARRTLRERFLAAGLGLSGANFLVAETGTLVLVTNEGNGRMCTTLPELHVAVVGIDKVVPDWDSLTVLLKLLARSATGQKLTTYTSFITGPRRSEAESGPKELHLVLLDNGRSRILADEAARETLKCIRCGCCLNVCPVYKNVGGYAYGWFISGPIGAIFTPQMLGTKAARELPYASTLCGACVDVCPVKIPITNILLHLRQRVAEGGDAQPPALPLPLRLVARAGRLALGLPWLYRLGARLVAVAERPFARDGWLGWLPPPLDRWTRVRPMPAFRSDFRGWWTRRKSGRDGR